jgi:hypothetical protein
MSRRSAHHRVKRNQQLIEAQRLLENHTMTDNTSHLERKLGENDDESNEGVDEFESMIQTKFENKINGDSKKNLNSGKSEFGERTRVLIGSSAYREMEPVKYTKQVDISKSSLVDISSSAREARNIGRRDIHSPLKENM